MNRDLSSAFLALARRWPNRTAIVTPLRQLTYNQMMTAAGTAADRLSENGVKPGSRVGIALTRNEDAFVVMLATWLIGASALVVDFRMRAIERQKLADTLKLVFFVQDRKAPGADPYPAFTIHIGNICDDQVDRPLPPPPGKGADPIAVIGVSSGTSGTPQAVALSHECLFARYAIARTSPQWRAGGRFAVSAPLAFSATRKHVLSRLLDGGTVIFLPLLVGSIEFIDFVNGLKADAVLTVPAILRGLFPLAPSEGLLFPGVRWLMSCGAPMSPEEKIEAREKLSAGFVQNYGSTMAGMVTLLETNEIDEHSTSVGRPLPHVLVEIVDDQDRQVPIGEEGRIRVRTPGAAADMPGKERDPDRQSDLIIDGWIYPGDIGFLNKDGFLTIVGRSSDVIIRGGVNIFPDEIEAVISTHPMVVESAVVGWPDPLLGEDVAAFVVLKEEIESQEIMAWCRSRLQTDKQPRGVFAVPALPRNANGKLVRRQLVARLPKR